MATSPTKQDVVIPESTLMVTNTPDPKEENLVEDGVYELLNDLIDAVDFASHSEFRVLDNPVEVASELDTSEEFLDASDIVDSENLGEKSDFQPSEFEIFPTGSEEEAPLPPESNAKHVDINFNRVKEADRSKGSEETDAVEILRSLIDSLVASESVQIQKAAETVPTSKVATPPDIHICAHLQREKSPKPVEEDLVAFSEAKMSETVVSGGGDTPIASKGAYQIDWDNLEQYDPFGGKSAGKMAPKKKGPSTPLSDGNANSSDVVLNNNDSNSNQLTTSPSSFASPSKTLADTTVVMASPNDNQMGLVNGVETPGSNKSSPAIQPKSPKMSAMVAPMVATAPTPPNNFDVPMKNVTNRPSPRVAKTPDEFESKLIPTSTQPNLESSEEEFTMASTDMFKDPGAMDFLSRAGGATSNGFVETELHKQSLYVRFDPLVQSAASSNLSPAAVSLVSSMDETITDGEADEFGDDLLSMRTPPKANASGTPSVTPATVTKKRPNTTPKPSPKTTPTARSDVDKLLSLTPKENISGDYHSANDSVDTSETAGGDALMALRLQYQAELAAKESEWSARLDSESKKSAELRKDVDHLRRQLTDCNHFGVLYMKTITQTSGEKDKSKSTAVVANADAILKDKEQALEDLSGVEVSFSDLHRRYEKLKTITEENKKNEEKQKIQLVEYQEKFKKSEDRFRRLKEHAETRLEKANDEIESLQKLRETDTLGLKATLKKKDITIESLENQLDQSKKEIQELTAICDELIAKHSI